MMVITVSNVHHALQLDSFYSRYASMLIMIIYDSINDPVNEAVTLLSIGSCIPLMTKKYDNHTDIMQHDFMHFKSSV